MMIDLRGKPCPKCGRKTLRVPPHPHAFGHKDYGMVGCYGKGCRFKVTETEYVEIAQDAARKPAAEGEGE